MIYLFRQKISLAGTVTAIPNKPHMALCIEYGIQTFVSGCIQYNKPHTYDCQSSAYLANSTIRALLQKGGQTCLISGGAGPSGTCSSRSSGSLPTASSSSVKVSSCSQSSPVFNPPDLHISQTFIFLFYFAQKSDMWHPSIERRIFTPLRLFIIEVILISSRLFTIFITTF